MVSPSHSSLLNSLGDALTHCPDPPAMQALARKQIASHCSEFFTSFSLQASYSWTHCSLWGRAGLGFDTVRGHLGPTGGMTKTSAISCHTSKGLMNRGSLYLCALLSPPGPLSFSQHKTVWPLSGPNWPVCSLVWALESQSPTFSIRWQDQVAVDSCSGSLSKDKIYPPDFQ